MFGEFTESSHLVMGQNSKAHLQENVMNWWGTVDGCRHWWGFLNIHRFHEKRVLETTAPMREGKCLKENVQISIAIFT